MSLPIKSEEIGLLLGKESTQGNSVTPDMHLGKIPTGEIEPPDPEFENELNYYEGGTRAADDKTKGPKELEGGSVTVRPYNGLPFAALLGEESYDSSTNVHTMTLKNYDIPPSFTAGVEYKNHDFDRNFSGSTFASGTISLEEGGELEVELDWNALDVDPDASITEVELPDKETFKGEDMTSELSLGSYSFARMSSIEFDVSNEESPQNYADGTDTAYEILYGRPELTISASIVPTDKSIYKEIHLNQLEFDTVINLENANGVTMEINMKNCKTRSAPHGDSDDGAIETDVEIVAETITVTCDESALDGDTTNPDPTGGAYLA